MLNAIRAITLRIKEDSEAYNSPVPLRIRCDLHTLGKWLYCRTYGMSPQRADQLMFGGINASPEELIWANRIAKNYGSILQPNGMTSHCVNVEESAFLAMIAYSAGKHNWERMLFVNGIHLEELSYWQFDDVINNVRERLELLPNTKFFYLEPRDVEADD